MRRTPSFPADREDLCFERGTSLDELIDSAKRRAFELTPLQVGQPGCVDELSHLVVQGGITNTLLKVFKTNDPAKACLARIFGPKTEEIIDREQERRCVDYLASHGIGKHIYVRLQNGQLEEWLEGRTFEPPSEMMSPDIARKIAHRVAALHSLPIPPFMMHTDGRKGDRNGPVSGSTLWPQLWKWLQQCRDAVSRVHAGDADYAKSAKILIFDLNAIEKEMHRIEAQTSSFRSPVVVGHNDLLCGNVFLFEDGSVDFIDFEYCAATERGFDIANHFNECVGFDCDWENYPSKEQQIDFIREYLSVVRYQTNNNSEGCAASTSDSDVESVWEETQAYINASHLFWGLWAIIQTVHSPIDFDFFSYAFRRLSAIWLPQFRLP
ncbi:unnamed protein product [Vitrella brassicaformis CCMP3155]|uniref:ethanolamine kinase n=2 Tax=Vitrella brassicaformis TaxID=1169539 RepID=A0A0G4EMD3_VITBC|nr:unnamed protein product [Vitrella brassicaformis CCMP3155]|eukprot:CEL98118.1 unnamed protein product [Vitrella brassicaformis CCMP3155]